MKIVWSILAKAQLYEIFQYHQEVAGKKVAQSVKSRIFEKVKRLSKFPEIGQIELNPLVEQMKYRYLVSGNVKIIYRVFPKEKMVFVASLFDTRQSPNDLKIGFYE
ncbi:MAG: type II toxin-antitoxin system RelE/ParE family toxin [Flammeovirgaceae bacterium]